MTLKNLIKTHQILKRKLLESKKKIKTLTRKEKIEEQKKRNNERKLRARILLKFGLVAEITYIIEYGTHIILGHLLKFQNISPLEKESLKNNGEKIFKELEEHDKKTVITLTTEEKKARNHKLIGIGALFEIANLINVNLAVITGYCYSLHKKDQNYINDCNIKGKLYFLKKGDGQNDKKNI